MIAVVLAAGCTESNFFIPPVILQHPVDNKVRVSGGFCAEGADDLEAFLKIMFIIDRSNSMQVTDPNNRRILAVADVIDQFIENPLTSELRAGVEFALISFWGDTATHTRNDLGLSGFSNDGPKILSSLVRIAETSSNTGYDKALSTAFQILDTDMARLSDKARPRSRYEVFFLSDGMPFPDNCTDESNSLRLAVQGAARIKALEAAHDVSVSLHAGFASDPGMKTLSISRSECECLGVDAEPVLTTSNCLSPPTIEQVTRTLLRAMANEGGGTFKQFENGDAINFLEFEFAESRRLYAMSYFVASNLNSRSSIDDIAPDSDGDGLSDATENLLGTSPYHFDSDGDGFSDGIEERFRLTGLDPLDPTDAQCNNLDRVDTDSDGLADCEERFLGTLRRAFDTDADGVPDAVEVLAHADANSATPLQDHQLDSDADGGTNAQELRWHTDPKADDVAKRAKIAYDYYQRELPITNGQACYDFEVRNISLASTLGAPAERSKGFCVAASAPSCDSSHPCPVDSECDLTHLVCHSPDAEWCFDDGDCSTGVCGNYTHQAGWNRLMLYMAQTPYDDPLADPLYRVACVDARFIEERDLKVPANGIVDLPLRRLSDTFRASPVLGPSNVRCHVGNNYDCGLDAIWARFSDDGTTCTFCEPAVCNAERPCPSGGSCFILPGNDEGLCQCTGTGPQPECGGGICLESVSPPNPNLCESINCGQPCPPCADGIDNDGDGLTDFPHDPDCFDARHDNEESDDVCSDGIDNDNDGLVDYPHDPGCADGVSDNDETDPATLPECANGIDDRGENGVADYPLDPGCYAASDNLESFSPSNPIRACNDGIDNDGDGQIDFDGAGIPALADRGCSGPSDIDEDGPAVCFHCQLFSDYLPGQCNIKAGRCRARSGLVPDGSGGSTACSSHDECRGSVCDLVVGSPTNGQCVRCLSDRDCDAISGVGLGICDTTNGWCLRPLLNGQITRCTGDSACAGACDTDIGYCHIDPYYACATERDCGIDQVCSEERGFCLERVFETHQCSAALACVDGVCDEDTGWCRPDLEEDRCNHKDECPSGDCLDSGACDQQTFVFPEDFRPEVDCVRQE
jgi:uncharacterized protein YegL